MITAVFLVVALAITNATLEETRNIAVQGGVTISRELVSHGIFRFTRHIACITDSCPNDYQYSTYRRIIINPDGRKCS